MADQMQLYDTSEKQSSNNTGKAKRKWENGFQRWSNRHSADGGALLGAVDLAVCVTIVMIIRMDARVSGR